MKDLSQYRDEFPVLDHCVYFNHAATGPLPRRTAEAMGKMAASQMNFGGMEFRDWIAAYAGVRESAARLINATPGEIAITKNTSEGLSFIANGLAWREGDVVVAVREEFPANFFPWRRLERRGVKLRWLELRNGRLDLDEIDEACAGARLLAVSYVHYLTGFRLDLDAVGEICRRRGCLFVVDAVQGLGPFPVDVRRSGVHALSASAHKWLLGPEGAGFLYLQDDLIPQIEPIEFGWTNVTGFPRYSREEDLRPDAGRFECGTLNTIGCFGLRASLELLLEVGVDRVGARVSALAGRVAQGAQAKGYRLAAPRDRDSGSGIVSIQRDAVDSSAVVRALAAKRISVAERHGWIRISPHFYNGEPEIDQLLQLLP